MFGFGQPVMKNNRRVKNARGKIPPDVRKNFQLFLYKVLVRIWQDLLQCMERIVLGDGISGDPHAEFVVLQAGFDIRHRQFEQVVLSVEEHTDVLTPVGFLDTRYPHTPFVHGVAFYMWIGGCQGTSNPLIKSQRDCPPGAHGWKTFYGNVGDKTGPPRAVKFRMSSFLFSDTVSFFPQGSCWKRRLSPFLVQQLRSKTEVKDFNGLLKFSRLPITKCDFASVRGHIPRIDVDLHQFFCSAT